MRINRIKKIFIFTAVCAMFLPFFAFFAVLPINAQSTEEFIIRTPTFQLPPEPQPTLKVQLLELSPEIKRLDQELNQAKPNETITRTIINNPANLDKLCGTFDIRCAIYKILYGIVQFIVYLPLKLSGSFLDWMTEVNLTGALYQSNFVIIGWGISRDVANIFFIFFVLWMALATIFQFESYSAKRLLPKLIIVALLVNFSLPIGIFVINTTNALGKIFYDAAKGDVTISDKILEIADIPNTIKAADISKADAEAAQQNLAQAQSAAEAKCNGLWEKSKDAVKGAINWVTGTDLISSCVKQEIISGMKNIDGIFANAYTSVFWMLIIGIVSTFVFFAGGIFLLVRYLSLVILLILGPLAFLFMILPATQEHWNKWWNKLIQWSFFAPAFMFMIMLSTRLGASLLTFQIASEQNADGAKDSIASLSLQYILIMGLFIASLFVAQSMGIAMSGTVVGWGRSMARGAGKYAKGASFRGAARMGGAYAKMALETSQARRMAATPIVRGLLRPLEAAVGAKRGVEEERVKQLASSVRSGNAAYAAARLQGERASVQAAYLRSASKEDIQKLEQGMGAQAMGGIMNQLKSIAPELGKKIGQSFKDVDLRIAATKGVTIGTPEFERAREEYLSEQTPYALGQILTAENLQKQWVQKYLLARGGEKEMNAITQTGEQIRALASIFGGWADREINNNTTLGHKLQELTATYQEADGYSMEQARRQTVIDYLPELLEQQAKQMGVATNDSLQRWAQAAPARVMLGEGRVIQRGTDMDELLRRLGGNTPQSPPPGGPAAL